MQLSEILDCLEQFAPPALQENYDNAGLLTGHREMNITGAIVSLDCTEAVIDEAIAKQCNLVIAHHPVIFSGLKKINGKNYVERVIIKAIKQDIAIYAIHTNLDNVYAGVNAKIGEMIGVKNMRILAPKSDMLRKLITFCPASHAEAVRAALFAAGAGHIGNYSECSFNANGTGTFKAGDATQPFVGEKGQRHHENEERIETVFPFHLESKILAALRASHPYEEIAYDIYRLENWHQQVGSGMIGEMAKPVAAADFLHHLKSVMKADVVRYTPVAGKMVAKVAVCGGAGSFLLKDALAAGADIFVTADFKYHQFFDGEGKIIIADIGHYETEQFTVALIADLLKQNFPTFAVRQTGVNTNPISYLT